MLLELRCITLCQMFGPSKGNPSDWLPSLETFIVFYMWKSVTTGDRRCCFSPSLPFPAPPPPLHWCVHIPQPHACVLQTAVKQSRLACVTACNIALGHARSLLPLKTECKEIINRFELRIKDRGGAGDCLREEKTFLQKIIKYLLTDLPPDFR